MSFQHGTLHKFDKLQGWWSCSSARLMARSQLLLNRLFDGAMEVLKEALLLGMRDGMYDLVSLLPTAAAQR